MHYSLYTNTCFTKVPTERTQTRLEENNTQSYESTHYSKTPHPFWKPFNSVPYTLGVTPPHSLTPLGTQRNLDSTTSDPNYPGTKEFGIGIEVCSASARYSVASKGALLTQRPKGV